MDLFVQLFKKFHKVFFYCHFLYTVFLSVFIVTPIYKHNLKYIPNVLTCKIFLTLSLGLALSGETYVQDIVFKINNPNWLQIIEKNIFGKIIIS